jgi:5-(carboxyamino)imidazole ribonucleotide mutase
MPANGGKNAALLALRILALADEDVAKKYEAFVEKQRTSVLDKDAKVQDQGWQAYLNG